MIRLAVTGQKGQLAQALLRLQERGATEVIAVGRPKLDLADPRTIFSSLEAAEPDAIVSAAAYTQVDQAEQDASRAYAVNRDGAGAVAQAATRLGVPLIHISTDYVFDGTKQSPYSETDAVNPLQVYGASKLAGESAVLDEAPQAVILRTAWVYSPFGANFVKTMLRLATARERLGVVGDQFGHPTSALDLAEAILTVVTRLAHDPAAQAGIFHLAGSNHASWADLAQQALTVSNELGGPSAEVDRIPTSAYPTPARRPAQTLLDMSRIKAAYGVELPDWRDSLKITVAELISGQPQPRT